MNETQAQQRAERLMEKWECEGEFLSELTERITAELLAVQRETRDELAKQFEDAAPIGDTFGQVISRYAAQEFAKAIRGETP